MKLITWNVNSVRTRLPRLLGVLQRHAPDVACLQELKCVDAEFPADEVRAAGYHAVVHGQKTYNGVAILARSEPADASRGFGDGGDDAQSRFLVATVAGVRVACAYVPNGGEVGSDKWAYKLAWYGRLRAWLDRAADPAQPFVLCGDFNVAPDDTDVAKPEAWADSVLCHPDGREALARVVGWGLADLVRRHHPKGGPFTWWDYRQLAFPKNDGLRIDHVLATAPLAARCTAATVDRDERKGKQPSDHAPVVVTFDP
jgi:exodeoxyribonuclease-3